MQQSLSYSADELQQRQAVYTVQEICQQPLLWQRLWQKLHDEQAYWQPFLAPLLAEPDLQIILSGAGSSAFIGKALTPWLREHTQRQVHAYATTDIVTTPLAYLKPQAKTLIVSFARSGNSPESVATIKLADQLVADCYHLVITCNPNGELAHYAQQHPKMCALIMPEGAHDQSFAMTSSFSSMMLSTLLLFGFNDLQSAQASLHSMSKLSQRLLDDWQPISKQLAKQQFKRVVYVGASCFSGLVEEAALKVLELTGGKLATRFDSTLGLRHGPKFMVDEQTLVVCLLSNDPYVRQYDLDLFNELRRDDLAKTVLALSGQRCQQEQVLSLDSDLPDCWLLFSYLLFAQMLALECSLALGLSPDNPCPTGEVNRVVQGVAIYPFPH